MKNSRKLKYLVLIFLLLVIIYAQTINLVSRPDFYNDFQSFFKSTQFLLKGDSIYSEETLNPLETSQSQYERQDLFPNLNPPTFAVALIPFALLDYRTAALLWHTGALLCGIIAVFLIWREYFAVNSLSRVVPVFVVLLAYFPTFSTVILGQVSLYMLLLLALAWLLARSGQDRRAGIILGLLSAIKLFNGLFLIFFLVRRRWRLLKWYTLTFLTANLISLLLVGKEDYLQYLRLLRNVNWYGAVWNASFLGYLTRIFGGSIYLSPLQAPLIATGGSYLLSLISLCLLVWMAWPRSSLNNHIEFDLTFCLTIIFMLLISPLGWMYYFVLLFLPTLTVWKTNQTLSSPLNKKLLILGWIMSTIPLTQKSTEGINLFLAISLQGVYFYALVIFLYFLVYLNIKSWKTNSQIGSPSVELERVSSQPTI